MIAQIAVDFIPVADLGMYTTACDSVVIVAPLAATCTLHSDMLDYRAEYRPSYVHSLMFTHIRVKTSWQPEGYAAHTYIPAPPSRSLITRLRPNAPSIACPAAVVFENLKHQAAGKQWKAYLHH